MQRLEAPLSPERRPGNHLLRPIPQLLHGFLQAQQASAAEGQGRAGGQLVVFFQEGQGGQRIPQAPQAVRPETAVHRRELCHGGCHNLGLRGATS